MTPEQYQRVVEIFRAATAQQADQRAEFVRRACGGDRTIGDKVLAMLQHTSTDAAALETPALGQQFDVGEIAADSERWQVPHPQQIGRFRILACLGQGGMGVVYRAEQPDPAREVALKVIRPGAINDRMLRRFRHEVDVLARLSHPGIAQVFEAGVDGDACERQPYFAMELVEGIPLAAYADQHQLDLPARLRLLIAICDAVQHAHQKGVVHRDLKPANILVTAAGQPKILDFGVARATDADVQSTTLATATGQLIGTLQYMSPEQAGGKVDQVDTRSDVYALGVILFELISGQLPYPLDDGNLAQAVRAIQEQEPIRLGTIDRRFRGDLETIVGKILEKEPARRYVTAAAVASDLRRFLAAEPIAARRPTTRYQLGKFARRHKPLVAAAAIVVVVLVGGAVTSTVFALREAEQRGRAEDALQQARDQTRVAENALIEANRQRRIAEGVNRFINEDVFEQADPNRQLGPDLTLRAALDNAAPTIERRFPSEPLIQAAIHHSLGELYWRLRSETEAEHHARRSAELFIEHRGANDPLTLTARDLVASIWQDQGRFEDALAVAEQVHETRREVFGDDHRETISSAINVGTHLQKLGRYEQAREVLEQVVEDAKRTLGDGDVDTLIATHNLSSVYYALGRLQIAHELCRDVRQRAAVMLGGDHPVTISNYHLSASILRRRGSFEEALQFAELAAAKRAQIFGEHHADTLSSQRMLASLLRRAGQLDAAEQLGRKIADHYHELYGPDHPSTIRGKSDLALVYMRQQQYEKATAMIRECLAWHRRRLGPDHPETLAILYNLVGTCGMQEQWAEAEALCGELVSLAKGSLPASHPRLGMFLTRHGELLGHVGRLSEARLALQEGNRILEAAYDETHNEVRKSRAALADLDAAVPPAGHPSSP